MADFAVVKDNVVVNVVVAESEEIAESVTNLSVVPITDNVPGMNWTLESDGWRPAQPFSSWLWDGTKWEPPVSHPATPGSWSWDENTISWINLSPDIDLEELPDTSLSE